MALASGTRLGPYEVVEPLGKGAMGEVYRARDSRLGRDVAVKVLPEHTASSPDALARFEFEARAVAALNHPNILALHDIGAADGISFAVTELLEGETLRDRLRREGPVPPRRALEFGIQFARGLAAAHASGIVHRDLKPENLFLVSDGRLKILDFGIAVHGTNSDAASAAETRLATEKGLLVGTVGYMAPEQVRGLAASERSDIFSYGLVVYEMLTGSNPFERGTPAETMAAILRDDAPSIAVLPGVPAVAARVIERCLEKRPDDRPESLRDIALFLDAPGTAIVPESSTGTAAVGASQIARWILAVACALLAIVTASSWIYVRSHANRAIDNATAADLARAENVVRRAQQVRLDRLRLSARLVASFPELKALFETNAPTIRDFLTSYQRGNLETPLLIALGPGASVLARGDNGAGAATESGEAWLKSLRASGDAGVITLGGRPCHAAVASAEAGGNIFGSIIAAASIDNAFAQILREASEEEVLVLHAGGVAGASLPSGEVPWESLLAFRTEAGTRGPHWTVTIHNRRYSVREIPLASDPEVSAVMLASRADLTATYRGVELGVVLIGVSGVVILLGVGLVTIRRLADLGRCARACRHRSRS